MLPGPSPSVLENVIVCAVPERNPTISATISFRDRASNVRRSPIQACWDSPSTSTIKPETVTTRPSSRVMLIRAIRLFAALQRSISVVCGKIVISNYLKKDIENLINRTVRFKIYNQRMKN
jgi:hypothetical protein